MANRFTFPIESAFDLNGKPISGAKLEFFASGTTVPADTFSDNALTVPNANPVIADSAGRFPNIFLQAIDYKVILKDAADVTIWTADPVSGSFVVVGDKFNPGPSSPEAMTIDLGAGTLFDTVTKVLVVKAIQTSPLMVAPASFPRNDIAFIDQLTGVVGIQTGVENASPVDPTIPDGKLPVARIRLVTTTVTIPDSLIDDILELEQLGDFGPQDIQNQTFTAFGDTGAVNAYVITPVPAISAYADWQSFTFEPANTNTAASTINVNGKGVIPIQKGNGEPVAAGDILAGNPTIVTIAGVGASSFAQLVSSTRILPPNHIHGLTISNNVADATNDIDIAIGKARDTADTADLVLSSGITRQLDIAFGTGNGGLSSTLTKAPNTWYHVILCKNSAGVVTVGFDTSETAANLIADHSITNPRIIGEIRTDAVAAPNSAIRQFLQITDKFLLKTPFISRSGALGGGTQALVTMLVPPTATSALMNVLINDGAAGESVYIRHPDLADLAPSATVSPLSTITTQVTATDLTTRLEIETNTLSQIGVRSINAIGDLRIATLGWISKRGQ